MPEPQTKLPPGAILVSGGQSSTLRLPPGATLVTDGAPNSAAPADVPWYKQAASSVNNTINNFSDAVIGTHTNEGIIKGFTEGIPYMVQHPIDSAGLIGSTMLHGHTDTANEAADQFQQPGVMNKIVGAGRYVQSGIPVAGPMLDKAGKQINGGDYSGALGTTGGVGAMVFGGTEPVVSAGAKVSDLLKMSPKAAAEALDKVNPRGVLAKRMTEKPAGEQFTRQEVLDAARANGVNLDLADATGNGVAQALKKANSISIAGKGTIEANATKNLEALGKWADGESGKYSPESTPREELGPQIQSKLQQDLKVKKIAAQTSYQDLDSRIGGAPQDVTKTVEAEARKIIGENKEYYDKHPELKPKQAWGILEDLAKRPIEKVLNQSPDVVLNSGEPLSQTLSKSASSKQMSWSELHQLRSDLMDFYRNNPDVVKGRSEAWIQRMVGKIDESMTSGVSGMSGADLEQFRHANGLWENIKSTYDNPSSPLYHAVRSQYPSNVAGMLSKQTPELAAQVRQTLGSLEGPFQRQVVESLINNKEGALDLKNLNSRLTRVSDDFLQAMLGKDGARNLRMLGKVSQKVTGDVNPSGTAKALAPFSEGAMLFTHPVAGAMELGANFASAKAITSPKLLDYLTMPAKDAMKISPRTMRKR
jgi:hypothetical protein